MQSPRPADACTAPRAPLPWPKVPEDLGAAGGWALVCVSLALQAGGTGRRWSGGGGRARESREENRVGGLPR